MLQYSSADSGPIGYGKRVLLVSILPFLPLLLFGIDPRASPTTEIYFGLSALWFLAVASYGLRQLWTAIWTRPR